MAMKPAGRGFFRNVLDAMIEARERQAERYVARALLSLDDETLRVGGFRRDELQRQAAPH